MKLAVQLLISLMFVSFAQAKGGMVGNGGDAILQEFNLRGIQLAAYLKAEPTVAQKYGVDAEKLLNVVKNTVLSGEDRLFLRQIEVDAINYPSEGRIEVSRTRWTESAKRADAYLVQRRIALHEYLWVYGIDDTNYVVSNPIIEGIEKAAGATLDPEVRDLVYKKFCDKIAVDDFVGAQALLSWGLDLNVECPINSNRFYPIRSVILGYNRFSDTESARLARRSMIKSLLEHGANPNFETGSAHSPMILNLAFENDQEAAKLLLEFGADPNWVGPGGASVFTDIIQSYNGPNGFAFNLATLKLLMSYCGDVNQSSTEYSNSPVRQILSEAKREDMVEFLLQKNVVDWCTPSGIGWNDRVIDAGLVNYKPLLEKYGVKCGRFKSVYGRGPTCEESKANGRKQCADGGFTRVIENKAPVTHEACVAGGIGGPDGVVHQEFLTSYSCLD